MGKRGAKFWVLLSLAGAGGCCTCSGVTLAVMGAAADSPASPTGPGTSAAAAEGGPDDFLYDAPSGLHYVATSQVVAEGVEVKLAGEWREDHRNIVLTLGDDSRYSLSSSGGVAMREYAGDTRANGSRSAERGTWSFEAGALTLTPDGYALSGSVGNHALGAEEGQAEAPRTWSVVGVRLEYTPHDSTTVRSCPALQVRGESPGWYYPSGAMAWTLRRAPCGG